MRLLALDLSTHCGWALLDGVPGPAVLPELLDGGCMELVRVVGAAYPWDYVEDVERQAVNLMLLAGATTPEEVVIEETNGGGRAGRYTQKLLEMLHLAVLRQIRIAFPTLPVTYISSADWRRTVGIALSKEEKRNNATIGRARRAGKEALREAKRRLGVLGKVGRKHVAVRWVEDAYNLTLAQGDNDFAEAVCLGVARLRGAPLSTPLSHRKPRKKKESTPA